MSEEPTEDDGHHAREYRIGELAKAARVPVRTLRYYQERRLLPPPRRQGRVGLYSEAHLARLRVIANLLDRGHTLEGIRELLSAWDEGRGLGAVLGVQEAVTTPGSDDVPVAVPLGELSSLFGAGPVERAVAAGLIEGDGDRVTQWSRRQWDATVALVQAGLPLEAVLSAGRDVQRGMDDLAATFDRLIAAHVDGEPTEALARLRTGIRLTVEAGLARAIDRRLAG